MIIEMEQEILDLIKTGESVKYKTIARNSTLFKGLIRAFQIREAVNKVEELKLYSFLHYERLKYDLSGLSSVRLDNRYVHRLIFKELDDIITLKLIQIDATHYGNKK